MKFIVLAVTKSYNGFCIAGMTERGKWLRPISRESSGRFWSRHELMYNGNFVRSGDVWEIEGFKPDRFEYPNHTEDFYVTNRTILSRISNNQLIDFLEENCEGKKAISDVFNANGRSICLVKADSFNHYTTNFDGKHRARMNFFSNQYDLTNPRTNNGNIVVKDCKWEGKLLRSELVPANYGKIYVCIGLATPNRGVEYPQVIGLHTEPSILESRHYPD